MYEMTFVEIRQNLRTKFPGLDHQERVMLQTLCVAEETGELVKEVRRQLGLARNVGSLLHVGSELADVYITIRMLAEMLELDLMHEVGHKLGIIIERGGV
jgi:NTP pyrophosphatase (non-canonical NTP hydrolase)